MPCPSDRRGRRIERSKRPVRFGRPSIARIATLAGSMLVVGFFGYNCYQRNVYGGRCARRWTRNDGCSSEARAPRARRCRWSRTPSPINRINDWSKTDAVHVADQSDRDTATAAMPHAVGDASGFVPQVSRRVGPNSPSLDRLTSGWRVTVVAVQTGENVRRRSTRDYSSGRGVAAWYGAVNCAMHRRHR